VTEVREIDRGLGRLRRELAEFQRLRIVVGYPEGGGTHTSGLSLSELGAIHEFGTRDGRIPSRSFLRGTFDEKRSEILAEIRKASLSVIDGQASALKAKIRVAKFAAKLVKYRFLQASKWAKPLADSTKDRKGHGTPLQDTKQLLRGLSWAVYDGGSRVAEGSA
jgi:hypothetical protein